MNMKSGDCDYFPAKDSSEKLKITAHETLGFDVKTEPGSGMLRDRNDKKSSKHMDIHPLMHASASQSKERGKESHDSEVEAKDFKLIESELGEDAEAYHNVERDSANEAELKKSPIRVQTTTFNKSSH